jgi:glucosylceramidase
MGSPMNCRPTVAASTLLAAVALFSVSGCFDSLDESAVNCRVDRQSKNCPSGYQCRVAPGAAFGRCCRPDDTTCGAVDAAGGGAEAGGIDGADSTTGRYDGARLEAGVDGIVPVDSRPVDLAGDTSLLPAVDADRDVPLGADATGGSLADGGGQGGAGGAGGIAGTGGVVAMGGVSGTGGGSGTDAAIPTGGVQGTGGAGTGGSTPIGTGGAPPPSTTVIVSSAGAYWNPITATEVASGTADVTVNDASTLQTWEGFGGTFNELGWSYLTSKSLQDEAIQLLFGANGAAFAWGRIPMGATDYATSRYTCDDTANDTTMASFTLARDQLNLIPYVKAAQAVKPNLRFWASPWTPPPWMKDNAAYDGGNMKSDAATLDAYALYFTKFVQGYKDLGITIEVVAPQNDPGYAQAYPTCLWTPAVFTSFIKTLGPAMAPLGVRVMLGTLSNGDDTSKDPSIASTVLADATAKGIVKLAGLQWGMLDASRAAPIKTAGLPVWATEHKGGNYPWNPNGYPTYKTTPPNDDAYAVESWGDLRDAIKTVGVTSYMAWNMVLDKAGLSLDTTRIWAQNALLVVDGGIITKTPAYYVFRHLSQYVVPGATVVETSGGDAIAFKNPDGSIVAVVYATSAKSTFTVKIGGKLVGYDMPAGWATVKYKP